MTLSTSSSVKSLSRTTLFGCLAMAAAALTPAHAQDASGQLGKYGCVACHAVDKKLVGPSFKDVAEKYRGKPGAEKQLETKVKNGGSGVWGSIPMPPNPTVPDADLTAMVRSILAQK